jgi:hypothetical protein
MAYRENFAVPVDSVILFMATPRSVTPSNVACAIKFTPTRVTGESFRISFCGCRDDPSWRIGRRRDNPKPDDGQPVPVTPPGNPSRGTTAIPPHPDASSQPHSINALDTLADSTST